MKKIYLVWVVFAYILTGCNSNTAVHEEHRHEAHEHEEGHDHEHEEHDHEHEGHDHGHEEAGGGHAGEISFKKALAEAVGLQTHKVEPGAFTDVIKRTRDGCAGRGVDRGGYGSRRSDIRQPVVCRRNGGSQGAGYFEPCFERFV